MSEVRFTTTFEDVVGDSVTIEILDTEFTGDATEFNTSLPGYRQRYSETGSEQTGPFASTEVEIPMLMQTEAHFALVSDFSDAQEGRFLVRTTKNGQLDWVGRVLVGISAYDEAYYPIPFVIRATDGVGTLKDVPFKTEADEFYDGKAKIIEYVTRALSKIGHISEFYGVGDVFIRTAVDWWEESMDHDDEGQDMLAQAYIDNAVYYTYKDGVQGVLSCYDVLKDILTAFNMRLTYFRGAFHLEQLPYRVADIIIQRRYDLEGSFVGASNYNSPNDIDQTANGALLSTGQYEFTTPIKKAEHRFAALEHRNFLAGAQNVDDGSPDMDTYKVPINSNNGKTSLRITGSLVIRISSNISEPGYTAPLDPFFAVMRLNLFLNTVGLKRAYTPFATFQFAYDPIEWDPTPGCYILQPINGVFLANTTDDTYTFAQGIDIMTPPLTESTQTFTVLWSFEGLKKYDGTTIPAADFNVTWQTSNMFMEAYSEGGPVLSGDGYTYYTENTDTQNTYVWKTEGLIGSSLNPNTVGAIWVKPGADYQLAAAWGAGSETPVWDFIGQMLTRDIAKTHAKPARKLSGTLYGDIAALSRVVWQGENWILLGGTWNAANNLFSGTWLEMKEVEGLTPSAPIKFVAWPDPVPPSTNTEVPGFDGPFRLAAPHGSVWYAIASTLTNENLRAGTPGTVGIQDLLSDYDFNAGDQIAIIHPLSGAFETLEVTTTTANGETSIAVTGDLVGDYPKGSPIVRIPRIGGPFSLPGGVSGQIMRHNGTKWTAYGDASMTDGHVLTWTDAGGWAPAAPSAGYTDEQAQDAVGGMMLDSTEIDFTYVDATPSLTAVLKVTGVSAGTYNSLTVDTKGRVTAASVVAYLTGNQTITLTGDVTGSGTTGITTTIGANKVTVGMLAQAAGLSVLLRAANSTGNIAALAATAANQYLRVNSAGTSLEWGTLTALTGNGVSGRIPVYNGATTFTNDDGFTYDFANGILQISTQAIPTTPTATIDLRKDAVTGDWEHRRVSANVSSNLIEVISNARNLSGTGNTIQSIVVGGANGGDPMVQFIVNGVTTWVIGIDNSDGDVLRILNQATPSSGSAGGEGIMIGTGTLTRMGINKTSLGSEAVLDIGGPIRGEMYKHVSTPTALGTFATGTGMGTGGTIDSLNSVWRGNAGICKFTTGTSPAANATVFTITMTTGYRLSSTAAVTVQGKTIPSALPGWGASCDGTTITVFYNGTLPASTAMWVNITGFG